MLQQWALVVVTGLLSAPHCIGMCGGIVTSVNLNASLPARRTTLLYNSGRIFSYTLLGTLMGTIGSFVDVAGKLAGVQGLASIIGGVFLLLWIWRKIQLPFMTRISGRLHSRLAASGGLSARKESLHILATGVAFGFLPCGLTYAMQMNAAATGTALGGAATMALFGLATFPALALAGWMAVAANRRWRRVMRKAGTAAAIIVGLISILRGLEANGVIPSITPWLW
ncbi:sulfite exporter TauE/SafE family protein [Paenibacillus protaetiae]|uniref:Sulfite exporter TauE/SafE family protein n=1 Tax=Paenibacillus protaetiae TaxID=2509456 RepID=A0A4P6ES22_9BACL|nr:sulfite exporter TauE/SafE family protein [Paenibacillus protaetiae]QAY65684.1 sulfite exporter TauE/SafE family protein [Paenibacillus protaetiae]